MVSRSGDVDQHGKGVFRVRAAALVCEARNQGRDLECAQDLRVAKTPCIGDFPSSGVLQEVRGSWDYKPICFLLSLHVWLCH